MYRIPYAAIIMMLSDTGKLNKSNKEDDEPEVIGTEAEELEFFGL